MNQDLKEVKRVQPEPMTEEQVDLNRKSAKKTAIVLAVIALGFFTWSVFIVMKHAAG